MRLIACTLLFSAANAKQPAPLWTGATLQGRVRLVGRPAKLTALKVTMDEAACGKTAPNERLIVGPGGGVKNAVVWLDAIEDAPRPSPKTARLDQKACVFVPHVQVVPVGSRLDLYNSDRVAHSVQAHHLESDATLFSVALPPAKGHKPRPQQLKEPGIVELRCGAEHGWSSAFIHVAEHPWYAVTDEAGRFEIRDAPSGEWVLRVWHESWQVVREDPLEWGPPVLLQREISTRIGPPTIVDFELRDF